MEKSAPFKQGGGNVVFEINGIEWELIFVNPNNNRLQRSDGSWTIGMCDNSDKSISINNRLNDYMTDKCLAHELCHAFCFSYDIHMSIQEEEFLADWVSRYGRDLITILDDLMYIVLKNRAA